MSNFYPNEPVLSHIMGEQVPNSTKRDKSWNNGQMVFGEVLKVHHKRYTADVRIFHTQDDFVSPDASEGRYACQIGVSSAGFSETYQMPYGEILPIHAGDIVLIGFLGNSTEQPVILKVFHDISESVGDANYRNILPNKDASGDITDYLNIMPIQDYIKIAENGDFEKVSHTKSFIIGTQEQIDTENFDFENLSVKFPVDKTVINPNAHVDTRYDINPSVDAESISSELKTIQVKEALSKPKTYLAVFRDKFEDAVTNWLRFIINAATTSFKIIQAKREFSGSENGAATTITLDPEGGIVIRRQLDTRTSNSEFESQSTKKYSEIVMEPDGSITVQTLDRSASTTDYPRTMVHLQPKGGMLSIYTTSKLVMNAKDGVNILSDQDITLTSKKGVSVASKTGTNITSDQDVIVAAKADVSIGASSKVNTAAPSVITSGSQERYGSDKSVGGTTKIGNFKCMGGVSVNGSTLVARGDMDSDADSNYALKGNRVVAAIQTFVLNKALDLAGSKLGENVPGAAALAGLIQMGSGLYNNYKGMSFNDFATKEANVATGAMIADSSPFYNQFENFANKSGIDLTSITGQMEFLTAPVSDGGLGLDILSGIEGMEDFEKTLSQASKIWNAFGKFNTLTQQLETCYNKSSEIELTDADKGAISDSCKLVSCEIQPSQFNSDIGGRDLTRDPKDMVSTSTLMKEGDKETKTQTVAGIEYETTHTKSIEDALNEVAKYAYPNGDWKSEVKKIEEHLDTVNGTNCAQYYDKNRKVSLGNSLHPNTEPAPITDKDQYCDRTVKRYVYTNAIKTIELANSSWKNYTVNQQIQMLGTSPAAIEEQENQYRALYG